MDMETNYKRTFLKCGTEKVKLILSLEHAEHVAVGGHLGGPLVEHRPEHAQSVHARVTRLLHVHLQAAVLPLAVGYEAARLVPVLLVRAANHGL